MLIKFLLPDLLVPRTSVVLSGMLVLLHRLVSGFLIWPRTKLPAMGVKDLKGELVLAFNPKPPNECSLSRWESANGLFA